MEGNKASLSRDTALEFLTKSLKLKPEVIKSTLHTTTPCPERLNFLNDIIRAFYERIPFQNIVLLSTPLESRDLPNVEFIINEVLAGRGGMCYVNNVFFYMLLEAIGYKVRLVSGMVIPATQRKGNQHGHAVTLVYDVTVSGDVYLAEVGCGYPVLEAIPMDFQHESPVYTHSYATHKYLKPTKTGAETEMPGDESVIIERWNAAEKERGGGDWWKFYEFSFEKRDVAFFESEISHMRNIYTNPLATSHFHNNIALNGFLNGRAVTIRNLDISVEGEENEKRENSKKDTKLYLKEFVKNHFPQLSDFVSVAMSNVLLE